MVNYPNKRKSSCRSQPRFEGEDSSAYTVLPKNRIMLPRPTKPLESFAALRAIPPELPHLSARSGRPRSQNPRQISSSDRQDEL